jgi:hypothetical protein
MNLTEMRTQARVYLDDRNSERFTDAEVTLGLNRAQEELQKLIDDTDEMYFSAGQNYNVIASTTSYEFTLPTDCKKVLLAERLSADTDPVPARWTQLARRHFEYTNNLFATNSVASPLCYLRGTKIGVVKPGSTYTLRIWYTKRLADLVSTLDTSEIPAEYHGLMCLWGSKFLTGSEDRPFSEDLEEELQAGIIRLTSHMEQRQKQVPRYVSQSQWEG